ncbi:6-phosphofructokinase [Clostridium cylindrosporum]|uniref:ATP-dependent 6-phosphofructokinase n=1 Tax=Clostridium cylindrosporum DSM 605 TaxID=1121307 RepID=A0A0J8D9T9_CLOCY|nr:6-phosphofructokinase [Clostridium cylindrosporum]KMT21058.1 ATP-dependent 6-phosphofructokinase PfkA [Clostridium cylindrosporum DSM 605]
MNTIGILTSGGDAPGMNAAIRAITRVALAKGIKVMGIQRGYNGLINGEIFEMGRDSVSDIIQRGGTVLKTARSEEFRTPEGREKAANMLRIFGIEGLIVLGGDGSFSGAQLLSNEHGIKTIGIPCTIDNDIAYTDFTIGFDTAINTVVEVINKLRDTSASHERVSIIEVMGRRCGDIALHAGIAGGAECVIIPEMNFEFDSLCRSIIETKVLGKLHYIVVVAEGAGKAQDIAERIEKCTGVQARATVPGHIQRGGMPSAFDRLIATKFGATAVEVLVEGKSQRVIGIKDSKIIDIDMNEALSIKKTVDKDLYHLANNLSI